MNQNDNRFPEIELNSHEQAAFVSFQTKFDPEEAEREYGEMLRNAADMMTLEQLLSKLRDTEAPSKPSEPRTQ